MTKVLKLHATYSGYYGGDIDEFILLPEEINGVLFPKMNEGSTYEIYLGEIEGKHSEVYGDIDVEIIDLDELSPLEVSRLIGESDFGEFESYFEGVVEEMYDMESEEGEYEKQVKQVYNLFDLKPHEYYWDLIGNIYSEFIKRLEEKYVNNFKIITVKEEDYGRALKILDSAVIETY